MKLLMLICLLALVSCASTKCVEHEYELEDTMVLLEEYGSKKDALDFEKNYKNKKLKAICSN